MDRRIHWDSVYAGKREDQMSWTQTAPEPSLSLISSLGLAKDSPIIDIGAGNSRLAEALIDQGFTDVSVLDISATAIENEKGRLGEKARHIQWIRADVLEFSPKRGYSLWHDRAAFHFLTSNTEIEQYCSLVDQSVADYLVMATFSESGPSKCSGLDVRRYSGPELARGFKDFGIMDYGVSTHQTPFHTQQDFLFCCLRRNSS